jgi:hypothetical protein
MRAFDIIPSAEIDASLRVILGEALVRQGFESMSPRAYVRSRVPGMKDLIRIQALKGMSYSPLWGLSLDFVPHLSGDALRWHRTAKSARFDLRSDPLDYIHPASWAFELWIVHNIYGLKSTRQDIKRVTKTTVAESRYFFSRVRTLTELVQAFERQKARKAIRFHFYAYSEQILAYAFTLARVGRLQDALVEFERYLERRDPPIELRAQLEDLLRKAVLPD